ncbi:MAG: hypothetical protein Kow0031_36360 [Anaerolineae bacterium]
MLTDSPRITSRLDLLFLVTSEFNAGLDINEVLYNVLTATIASVGASEASLFLVDEHGEVEQALILHGFKIKAYPNQINQTIFGSGLAQWVWNHRRGAIVRDTSSDERWYQHPSTPELAEARSGVCVPVQKPPNPPLGVLTITTDKTDYFDESDLAMLTIIADQAAFALTNARLIKAERMRRKLADTLSSIARTINASLNLNEVLDLILEQLALVIDYDSSSILLYDEHEQELGVKAARGFADMADALAVRLPYNENIPNYRAILEQRPLVISNVDADPHWQKTPSSSQVKSWIGAPLIARGKVVGILTVDSYEIGKYSTDNLSVVAAFADQAATAVANAQWVSQFQQAEANYAALFEDSTDMIIITDYNGTIHNINRKGCQFLRRPKDAIVGLQLQFFAPQLKGFIQTNYETLQAWREETIEVEILDAYRQKIPLEIRVRHVQFGNEERVEWVGRDISRRKEIERMRQDLVNMLVHDLRGPLGNLINTIDLIAMMANNEGNTNLLRFLEMGKRTGRTLTDLVDSMLDVSRLEQGDVPLQCSGTNLEQLLSEVQEQVEGQADAKDTTLLFHPLPVEIPPQVWLDNSLIRRVLTNLVSNAIKYAPEEAQVELTTSIETGQLCFAVKDNGPGISKKDQRRIFDKFSRINTSPDGPAGVGLGLAFCKLAIEAHQGQIRVESSGIEGEGSTFFACIPLATEPDD